MWLSTADVTSKIEDFISGIPGDVQALLGTVQADVNNTEAFVKFLSAAAVGIAGNASADLRNFTQVGGELPLNIRRPCTCNACS